VIEQQKTEQQNNRTTEQQPSRVNVIKHSTMAGLAMEGS